MLNRKRANNPHADSLLHREDLKIRSLLDYPALRQAMSLDVPAEAVAVKQAARPKRRFDRRQLLESVSI
jgi:hypothetical protein